MSAPPIERRYARLWGMPNLTAISGGKVGGLVVPFGRRSQPMAGYVEFVAPTAFRKCAGDGWPDVVCFSDHGLLGSTRVGTLRFSATDDGLHFEADVPKALPVAVEYAERGDYADIEIRWQVYEDRWTCDNGGYPVRELLSIRLVEISPATISVPDDRNPVVALQSLALSVGEPVEYVRALADRKGLRELFGYRPPEPILLGKNGRQAHIETIEAEEFGALILDQRAVKTTPKDLARENAR